MDCLEKETTAYIGVSDSAKLTRLLESLTALHREIA